MNIDLTEWDEDLKSNVAEEHQALLRTLKRTQGFALLFVECSLARGNKLIEEVRRDLPQKSIEVLQLKEAVENFYEVVENLQNREQFNILFVQGLQHSFYEYEQNQALSGWDSSKRYSYSWEGVPRVLMNLNQQRERLRDHFPVCFVFLLPLFGSKYFIQRAPDFFDWRSGFFEFPDQEKEENIEIKDLSSIFGNAVYNRSNPLDDLVRYDKAIEIEPDFHIARFLRGVVLGELGRYEDAIADYDKAIEIKPDFHIARFLRGVVLGKLGRYEDAIADYDKAIEITPDYYEAWYRRGNTLNDLGRYEEALTSFDKAVKIKPDADKGWSIRGFTLRKLRRYEEAIASYDKALEIKPDFFEAWCLRGIGFDDLGRYEEAIASYDKALEIKPDFHIAWYGRGAALGKLGRYEEAITSFDKVVEIKPDYHIAWNNRGTALGNLGRDEEAIASYDKALETKSDDDLAWYNKACCYALQDNTDLALENLQHAIQLNPEYRQLAETDSDFDSIRENSRFQILIQGR